MKKKELNLIRNKEYIEELNAYGYSIEFKQPWHWRISYPDSQIKIDVWPTNNKYWIVGSPSKTKDFSNLLDTVKSVIFNY